jgi:hypothetical protein
MRLARRLSREFRGGTTAMSIPVTRLRFRLGFQLRLGFRFRLGFQLRFRFRFRHRLAVGWFVRWLGRRLGWFALWIDRFERRPGDWMSNRFRGGQHVLELGQLTLVRLTVVPGHELSRGL